MNKEISKLMPTNVKKYKKIIVYEARIPLIKKIIADLEKIQGSSAKLSNYKKMLHTEEKKLQSAYDLLTPHESQ